MTLIYDTLLLAKGYQQHCDGVFINFLPGVGEAEHTSLR